MRATFLLLFFLVLYSVVAGQDADGAMNTDPEKAEIVTSDIDLFWSAYDSATPANDLVVYRDRYLEQGSTGLKEFYRLRIESVCDLVATINARPGYYSQLRAESLKVKINRTTDTHLRPAEYQDVPADFGGAPAQRSHACSCRCR